MITLRYREALSDLYKIESIPASSIGKYLALNQTGIMKFTIDR